MARSDLVDYLQAKISEYLNGRRYQTLVTLSERSGVPYNTLRRISAGSVDKPNLETVLALLRVIESPAGVVQTVKRFFPTLGEFLAESRHASRPEIWTDEWIDSSARDAISYKIFSMGGTRAGITDEDVIRLYGADGVGKLERMLEKGLLYRDGKGIIRAQVREYSSVDADTILAKLKHGVETYDPSLEGTDGSYAIHRSESVNMEGLRAIKRAVKDFYFDVAKIKNNQRYSGTVPFYANILLGLYDSARFVKENQNEWT